MSRCHRVLPRAERRNMLSYSDDRSYRAHCAGGHIYDGYS
ncbi:hypothetical protein X975_12287, partial [Stegodyphus mimosarum]